MLRILYMGNPDTDWAYRDVFWRMLMGNILREIFNNDPPSKEYIQMIAEMKKEAASYKSCTVCKHYSYDAYVSGMTHYEGDCDIGLTALFGKKENPCKHWEIKDGCV